MAMTEASNKQLGTESRMQFALRGGTFGMQIQYRNLKVIGEGHTAVVRKATAVIYPSTVAMKHLKITHSQDPEKTREVVIMRKFDHQNIIKLFRYEYERTDTEANLHLILEQMPSDLRRYMARSRNLVIQEYKASGKICVLSPTIVKVYMFQVFRALAYMHSKGICHRSVKPENILVDYATSVAKLCDFGRSEHVLPGKLHANTSSRGGTLRYRAPEMLYGSRNSTFSADMWSAGCVLAETMMLTKPLFNGLTEADLRKSIAGVLGPPNEQEIAEMNPKFDSKSETGGTDKNAPIIHYLNMLDKHYNLESNHMLFNRLLKYAPDSRWSPLAICASTFFYKLRQQPPPLMPNGRPLPPLFNFTAYELSIEPELNEILLSKHQKVEPRPIKRTRVDKYTCRHLTNFPTYIVRNYCEHCGSKLGHNKRVKLAGAVAVSACVEITFCAYFAGSGRITKEKKRSKLKIRFVLAIHNFFFAIPVLFIRKSFIGEI